MMGVELIWIQTTLVSSFFVNYDKSHKGLIYIYYITQIIHKATVHNGLRCSSMVRVFDHGVMGRQINPSWCGPIELFLVPASAPRLV